MTDPLNDDQRQRLAALYATRDALHVDVDDAFGLIHCAHWVTTGKELPTTGTPIVGTVEHFSPDAASWTPGGERADVG